MLDIRVFLYLLILQFFLFGSGDYEPHIVYTFMESKMTSPAY